MKNEQKPALLEHQPSYFQLHIYLSFIFQNSLLCDIQENRSEIFSHVKSKMLCSYTAKAKNYNKE